MLNEVYCSKKPDVRACKLHFNARICACMSGKFVRACHTGNICVCMSHKFQMCVYVTHVTYVCACKLHFYARICACMSGKFVRVCHIGNICLCMSHKFQMCVYVTHEHCNTLQHTQYTCRIQRLCDIQTLYTMKTELKTVLY